MLLSPDGPHVFADPTAFRVSFFLSCNHEASITLQEALPRPGAGHTLLASSYVFFQKLVFTQGSRKESYEIDLVG